MKNPGQKLPSHFSSRKFFDTALGTRRIRATVRDAKKEERPPRALLLFFPSTPNWRQVNSRRRHVAIGPAHKLRRDLVLRRQVIVDQNHGSETHDMIRGVVALPARLVPDRHDD